MEGNTGVRRRLLPGKANDYINNVETIQPRDNLFLWCRVSIKQNADHLDDQQADLRIAAKAHGAPVVGTATYIGPGYDHDNPRYGCWATALSRAAARAKALGAKLLATELDRFVRHPAYGKV